MKLNLKFCLILFLLFPIHTVNAQANNELMVNSGYISEVESARNFMIDVYSKKIQDHILILFTVVSAWYAFLKIEPNNIIRKNKHLFSFLFACLIWLSFYSYGRLVFWSQYNSLLLVVEPYNRTNVLPVGYAENIKWSLHDSILRRIRCEGPYNDADIYPRTINIELANVMSGSMFFNFRLHVIFLLAFYGSFYRDILQKWYESNPKWYSRFVTIFPALIVVFLGILKYILY